MADRSFARIRVNASLRHGVLGTLYPLLIGLAQILEPRWVLNSPNDFFEVMLLIMVILIVISLCASSCSCGTPQNLGATSHHLRYCSGSHYVTHYCSLIVCVNSRTWIFGEHGKMLGVPRKLL